MAPRLLIGILFLLTNSAALRGEEPLTSERKAAARKTLKLLSAKVRGEGLTHESGNNGRVVVHATAGLAFLASGSTLAEGPYRWDLVLCARYVNRHAGVDEWGDKQWDQTTWGLAHATIFFAHLHRTAPDKHKKAIEEALERCVDLLVKSQTDRGGWCHGQLDTENALKYTDLVATTNLALYGLGLAKQEKVDVPEETIATGVKYLLASSDGQGRIGYSPRDGQRGFVEPGRNAGALLAFGALGLEDHREYPPMRRRFHESLGERLNKGHGSAQLALLQAALVSKEFGEFAWRRFWLRLGPSLLACQDEEGHFTPPEGEKSITESGDRATATYALILSLPEGHLQR